MSHVKEIALEMQEREALQTPNTRRGEADALRFRRPHAFISTLKAYQDAYRALNGKKLSEATIIELAFIKATPALLKEAEEMEIAAKFKAAEEGQ